MTPQEHIKELRDALGALYAVQNGPPLCKDELEWCRAMDEAERLLAMDALPPLPDKPKRYGCHCELGSGEKPDDCGVFTGYYTYGEQNLMPKACPVKIARTGGK